VVTTLHTVLLRPNADQYRVMRELIARSSRLVVMTERGRTILQEVYQAPPSKVDLIPHGIPDVVYIVLGATHPHELLSRGEAYRLGL
jgi:hypothetical protein